jgi:hypothetical protein
MAIAAAAVNQFKTVTQIVGINTTEVYEAPIGFVGIVLLAQTTNISTETETFTLGFRREGQDDVDLIKSIPIPADETAALLSGKLVLETGDKLVTVGSTTPGLKFLLSVLETTNI